MDLETVVQGEVSQKEKNKHCTLIHICGIQKNGIDYLICEVGVETQTQRTDVQIAGEEERWDELGKRD